MWYPEYDFGSLVNWNEHEKFDLQKKTLAKQQHEQNEYIDGFFRELGMSEKILKCAD